MNHAKHPKRTPYAKVLLVIGLSVAGPATAQTCAVDTALAKAAATFRPVDAPRLEQRRQEVLGAMQRLDALLAASGADRAADWRAYLRWSVLAQQIDAGEAGDAASLRSVLARFRAPYAGLELVQFTDLRAALGRYVAHLELRRAPSQATTYQSRLDDLRSRVGGRSPSQVTASDLDDAGRNVAWLEDAGQAPELTSCLRALFGGGNLRLGIGMRLMGHALRSQISQVTPINEMVNGSHVTGSATTQGTTGLTIVPNEQFADLRIAITGQTVASTQAVQQRVAVRSSVVTDFIANRRIVFDGRRFLSQEFPVHAQSHGQIHSVEAYRLIGRHLAERIGWQRAREAMPQVEARASRQVAQQVSDRLRSQTDEALRAANELYKEFVGAPLTRVGFETPAPVTRTTLDTYDASFRFSRHDQLGAPWRTSPAGQDFGISVHESAAANVLGQRLALEVIDDREVEDFVQTMTGAVPDELRTGPDRGNWRMTLAGEDPLVVSFRGGQVMLTLAAGEILRHSADAADPTEEIYHGRLTARAAYAPRLVAGAIELVRVGEATVTFEGPVSEGLAAFVRRKADALFVPSLTVAAPTLPAGRLLNRSLRLDWHQAAAADGWLDLGALARAAD